MRIQLHSDKGFSLIELLVALTIFSIGLLAVAGMQLTAIQGNSKAHGLTAMTALADGLVEQLWSRPGDDPMFSSNVAGQAWPADFAVPETAAQWSLNGAGLCSATYDITVDQPIIGVTEIEVVVSSGNRTMTKTALKRTY